MGLGTVGAFGFGEGFEDFEIAFDLFIFGNCLFIDSMKPIVYREDLIENGGVGRHE